MARPWRPARLPLLLLVLAVGALALSPPAAAHTIYQSSDPAANSILPTAPTGVTVHLTERAAPGTASIRVTDVEGQRFDENGTRISSLDARTFSTDLASLAPGVYTVVWSVTSADDGHPSGGSFSFCVQDVNGTCAGSETLGPVETGATSSPTSPLDVALRAASYLATAASLGACALALLVWWPSSKGLPSPVAPSARHGQRLLTLWAGGHALGLSAYSTAWLAWSLMGTSGLDPWRAISGSAFLQSLLLRAVLAGALGALLLVLFRSQLNHPKRPAALWTVLVPFLLAASLVVPIGAASHAASNTATRPLGAVVDGAHVLFISLWAGGLLGLLVVRGSLAGPENALLAKRVLTRFSTLAAVSLGGVIAAGLLLSVSQVGSLEALVTTSFGLVVLAKVSLAVPMASLGALNRFRSIPYLADPTKVVEAAARVARNVRVEAALGVTILVLSGLLTTLVPSTSLDVPTTEPPAFFLEQVQSDVKIELQVYPPPGGPGAYIISVLLTWAATGDLFLNSTAATATFHAPDGTGIPDSREDMLGPHDNHYFVDTTALSVPGQWRLTVSIERNDGADIVPVFYINIKERGS